VSSFVKKLKGVLFVYIAHPIPLSSRHPEFVTSYWAIHLLGAIACPLNSFNDGDTLAFCIQDVSCRVIIVDGERLDRLEPYLPNLQKGEDGVHAIVVMPRMGVRRATEQDKQKYKGKSGVHDWDQLMATSANVTEAPQADVQPDDGE
jgi:acyl-CoA synthetase (AMP-forming)/AMP-acid ligase II